MDKIELKSGKKWALNTAYHGDCINFMKELPDKCIDLVLTDPPYGIDAAGKKKSRNRGIRHANGYISAPIEYKYKVKTWDKQKPSDEYFKEIIRVSKNQIIWGVNYFPIVGELGSGRVIWDKVNGTSSFSDCEIAYSSLHSSTRLIRYMWNGMLQGKSIDEGHIQQGNKQKNEKRIHPTQKPVKLIAWTLGKYAKEKALIFDPFLGSFSTAIACHKLGFSWLGCERESDYFEAGHERYMNEAKQLLMDFTA